MMTAPTMMKWKCATTKYVSCQCTSSETVATAMPVMPPNTMKNRKPQMYTSGALTEIAPRYSVPTQLNTLMAVNTPTNIEMTAKAPFSKVDWPETNMWWPQAKKPTNAMPSDEYAIIL